MGRRAAPPSPDSSFAGARASRTSPLHAHADCIRASAQAVIRKYWDLLLVLVIVIALFVVDWQDQAFK